MGIASLIIGIVSLILSFIPCINTFDIAPALAGLAFGIIALVLAKGRGRKDGMALAGAILNGCALLIIAIWWGLVICNPDPSDDVERMHYLPLDQIPTPSEPADLHLGTSKKSGQSDKFRWLCPPEAVIFRDFLVAIQAQ